MINESEFRKLKLHNSTITPGPSCSKLKMSLVNHLLKFISSDMQICWNFLLKNIRILYIESAKTVNEMTHNKLVKLMMLWTTGPR